MFVVCCVGVARAVFDVESAGAGSFVVPHPVSVARAMNVEFHGVTLSCVKVMRFIVLHHLWCSCYDFLKNDGSDDRNGVCRDL